MKPVDKNERLSRFLSSRSHYSSQKREVKFGAFIGPKDSQDLSIFRTSTLSETAIWSIGENALRKSSRGLKARADLLAECVFDIGLEVVPETSDHPRHANIRPFPVEREQRQSIARELALKSTLVVFHQEEN